MFDVAPIEPIAHTDWLQSLRELVPHLSRLFLSCVFHHLSCRVATGGSVIQEKGGQETAQGATALIPLSADVYVHTLPNILDPKRHCG